MYGGSSVVLLILLSSSFQLNEHAFDYMEYDFNEYNPTGEEYGPKEALFRPARVQRSGRPVPATPNTLQYNDIQEALHKIMPHNKEFFAIPAKTSANIFRFTDKNSNLTVMEYSTTIDIDFINIDTSIESNGVFFKRMPMTRGTEVSRTEHVGNSVVSSRHFEVLTRSPHWQKLMELVDKRKGIDKNSHNYPLRSSQSYFRKPVRLSRSMGILNRTSTTIHLLSPSELNALQKELLTNASILTRTKAFPNRSDLTTDPSLLYEYMLDTTEVNRILDLEYSGELAIPTTATIAIIYAPSRSPKKDVQVPIRSRTEPLRHPDRLSQKKYNSPVRTTQSKNLPIRSSVRKLIHVPGRLAQMKAINTPIKSTLKNVTRTSTIIYVDRSTITVKPARSRQSQTYMKDRIKQSKIKAHETESRESMDNRKSLIQTIHEQLLTKDPIVANYVPNSNARKNVKAQQPIEVIENSDNAWSSSKSNVVEKLQNVYQETVEKMPVTKFVNQDTLDEPSTSEVQTKTDAYDYKGMLWLSRNDIATPEWQTNTETLKIIGRKNEEGQTQIGTENSVQKQSDSKKEIITRRYYDRSLRNRTEDTDLYKSEAKAKPHQIKIGTRQAETTMQLETTNTEAIGTESSAEATMQLENTNTEAIGTGSSAEANTPGETGGSEPTAKDTAQPAGSTTQDLYGGKSTSSPTLDDFPGGGTGLTTTVGSDAGGVETTIATHAADTATAAVVTTPGFDVDMFLEILANLTYDYDTNLTMVMNLTLKERGAPTCGTPKGWYAWMGWPNFTWPTPSTITTTTTTTEPYVAPVRKLNNTVIAKCFVCGLKETGIPFNSDCADSFAGDFLPLVPMNPLAKAKAANYRKYCRYGEIYNYLENATRPKSIYGRWTGGCSVRWTDLTGLYTQRACRNRRRPTTGEHYASKRMAKLEFALSGVDNGCIITPAATLIPMSRGISLYARFHACVCTGSWCNVAAALLPHVAVTAVTAVAIAGIWSTLVKTA